MGQSDGITSVQVPSGHRTKMGSQRLAARLNAKLKSAHENGLALTTPGRRRQYTSVA